MPSQYVCLICHHEIPHPAAECPHCKSRRSTAVGITPRFLGAVFLVMILSFVVTGLLTGSFNAERRQRARLHYQTAKTLSDYGYYERAIEEYREALNFDRGNVDYRLGLALSLYRLKRFNEAKLHLIELHSSDPNRGLVSQLLAQIAVREERWDEAITYYRNAVYGRWPGNPQQNRIRVRFELIELLEKREQRMQAVSELLELLREAPDNADVKRRIGWHFLEAGAPDNASEVFADLIRSAPQNPLYYLGRGKAEFALGNYLTARSQFRRALRLDPSNSEVQQLLDLTNEINRLDPTSPGIDAGLRYRRSLEIVKRALELIEYCLNPLGAKLVGPPAPVPASVADPLKRARNLVRGKTRQPRNDKSVQANISLAEALWRRQQELCPASEKRDEALRHVLRELSR